MNNVARMNGSYRTCESVKSHACMGHVAHICHVAHMSHTWLLHAYFHVCACVCMCVYVWVLLSFRCVTWVIQMRDMTHSYILHDSFCERTHSGVWFVAFRCVTWLISYIFYTPRLCQSCPPVWGISRAYEWVRSHTRGSHITNMNESCRTYEWVMLHVRMSHVARTNESCRT